MQARNEMNSKGRLVNVVKIAIVLTVVIVSVVGCKKSTPGATTTTPQPAAVPAGPPQNTYAGVVDHVAPAVVTIRSARRVRAPQQQPFLDDPFFRNLFGDRGQQQPPKESLEHGLGSGVIVSQDGYILTNHHVIDGAEQISVDLVDKRTFSAKLVGSDKLSDLAVLKIDVNNLPVLGLGDSDKTRVGDVVLAVGNPLGIGQTVTMGIISAKGRSTGLSDGSFEDFLQTDAAINKGNSGGALVNANGELIGINSQILSPSGGNIGIGFAIPTNMAKSVMDQLIHGGKVRRAKLGVTIQQITSELASTLGLKEVSGALINAVEQGGPAEKAGLKQGDVITAIDGTAMPDSNSVRNHIAGSKPGSEVTITYIRDGSERTAKVTLGELTSANAKGDSGEGGGSDSSPAGQLGMTVQPMTPDIARQLQIPPTTQGVVITQIDPSGPAAEATLQEGDVIVEVNHQQIKTPTDLSSAVEKAGKAPSLLLVNRRGTTFFGTIRPKQQ